MIDFESFKFHELILKALRDLNILVPTPLQKSVIPEVLKGGDVLVAADPGLQRTLSFVLPAIEKLIDRDFTGRTVVLTASSDDTFELENDVRKIARFFPVRILALTSGIEKTGGRYDAYAGGKDAPHVVIGEPASFARFAETAGFDRAQADTLVLLVPPGAAARGFADAAAPLLEGLREECQRIMVTERETDDAETIAARFLRAPAVVYGPAAPRAPRQEPQAAKAPQVTIRTMKPQRPKARPRRPEDGGLIEHFLYLPGKAVSKEEFLRIVRAEAAGRTLVVVEDGPAAAELSDDLRALLPDRQVAGLPRGEGDALPPPGAICVGDMEGALALDESVFNVVILRYPPLRYQSYLHFMKLLAQDPGDRIVMAACVQDLGTIFNIKAAFGVRLQDLLLPSERALASQREAQAVNRLAQSLPEPDEAARSLARRVKASPFEEKIVAQALSKMVASLEGQEGARAAAPPPPRPAAHAAHAAHPDEGRRPRHDEGRGGRPDEARGRGRPEAGGRGRPEAGRPPRPDDGRRPRQEAQPRPRPAPEERAATPQRPPEGAPRAQEEPGGAPERMGEALLEAKGRQPRPRGYVEPMSELRLSAGRADGVDAEMLFQWLQSRLAMRASEFGPVQVGDQESSIFVPPERVSDAVAVLGAMTFNEKQVQVEVIPPRRFGRR